MQKENKFFKITFIYFISLLCFVVVRIATALGALSMLNDYVGDAVFTSIVQLILMGVLPLTLYIVLYKKERINKTTLKHSLNEIGFNKISIKTVVISLLLGLCAYIFNLLIASFFDALISSFGYSGVSSGSSVVNGSLWFLFFNLFFTAVLPGTFEEVLHRGILLKGIKSTKNYIWAIILSGLFFGFMHLNINQFFYASIIGCFFAFIAIISKSIWPSIIMHFVNNAINVYLSWASTSKAFGANFYSNLNHFLKNENFVIVVVSVICFMIVLSLLTLILVIVLFNENNKDKKICLRLSNTKRLRDIVFVKLNSLDKLDTSLNYNTYVSAENSYIQTDDSVASLFSLKNRKAQKFDFKYNIFFYATLILGALITISTFIWGVL